MRIHNYGNDYVQANKFREREIINVENKTEVNRPEPTEPIPVATEKPDEAQEKAKVRYKKKNSDKTDNVQ